LPIEIQTCGFAFATKENAMSTSCRGFATSRLVTFGIFAGTLAVGLLAAAPATAMGDHPAPPAPPKALEPLRKLVGTWQGEIKMGGHTMPVTIVYEPTAAGSAIVERLFPGTPHEMLSVYVVEGETLAMTHYCTSGNHPKMMLKKSDPRGLSFEMTGSEGLGSPNEMHMHAMSVSFTDADHIKETWTSFDKGKVKEEKVFALTRKK
jgi:hypothetical protein